MIQLFQVLLENMKNLKQYNRLPKKRKLLVLYPVAVKNKIDDKHNKTKIHIF